LESLGGQNTFVQQKHQPKQIMRKSVLALLAAISAQVFTLNAQCLPAVTFNDPGIFHIPTVATPVKRITHQPPAGTYYKIHMTMDLKLDAWDPATQAENHLVFWLVRDGKNTEMMGLVCLYGPGRDELMVRHGWNNNHGSKLKQTEKTKLFANTFVPGGTYTFDYTYDAANQVVSLFVIDKANGQQRMRMISYPNTDQLPFSATQDVTVDFGFNPTINPNEVASYGWEYSNLKIELFDDLEPSISASSVVKATCTTCPDGQAQVSVTGGSAPYTYVWAGSSNTAAAINSALPGGYTVTVTDKNGCKGKKNIAIGLLPDPNTVLPVKISDDDPHWVEYKGKLTYLNGFTHGLGSLSKPTNYYKTYLDWLSNNNINCFRNTPFMGQGYFTTAQPPAGPFKRTGPGLANDGFPKYDLAQYEAAFFTYWKNVLSYAQQRNVIMFFTIFDGWHLRQWDKNACNGKSTGATDEWCHTYDTYYGANNINGVNAANITQYHDPGHAVNQWQKQFIAKVVDELGHFPNVIFEVCNENFQNRDWETKLGNYLTNYELSKGMTPHLVLGKDIPNHEMTPGGRQTFAIEDLHKDLAGVAGYAVPHVFHNDGPNQGSAILMRNLTWASLTAGVNANIFSVTNWNLTDSVEMSSADYQNRLKYVGYAKKFLNDFNVDLRGMSADAGAVTNDTNFIWCLARTGEEYIIYMKNGGNTTVSGLPATYNAFWFNPRTGTNQAATASTGTNFIAPDNNDWVLYIRKPKKTDVEPVDVMAPLHDDCKDTMSVYAQIENKGGLDLYNIKVSYKLDNNAAVTQTFAFSPWIKTGEKTWVSFPQALKNIAGGSHTLKIWTSVPNDATDSNMANDTLTLSFNNGTQGKTLPFVEDFETGLPADWTVFDPDGKETWFVYGAGYNSGNSAVINNYAYTGAYFQPDYLAVPGVDLTTAATPQLSFWYSHASKPTSYRYDSLEVLISTDCAGSWTPIWTAGGSALNTAPAKASLFIPSTPGEWMNATVDLTPYNTSSEAIIMFRNWSNNNNSILLDKINIDNANMTAVEEEAYANTLNVFPNPASEFIYVSYTVAEKAELKLKLVNALGQTVAETAYGTREGKFDAQLDVRSYPAGIYNLILTVGNKEVMCKKAMIAD
jgi:hypothetical protein